MQATQYLRGLEADNRKIYPSAEPYNLFCKVHGQDRQSARLLMWLNWYRVTKSATGI